MICRVFIAEGTIVYEHELAPVCILMSAGLRRMGDANKTEYEKQRRARDIALIKDKRTGTQLSEVLYDGILSLPTAGERPKGVKSGAGRMG